MISSPYLVPSRTAGPVRRRVTGIAQTDDYGGALPPGKVVYGTLNNQRSSREITSPVIRNSTIRLMRVVSPQEHALDARLARL